MAQWGEMNLILQLLDDQTITNLYPSNCFPIELRHFLANWIEGQRWEDFALENPEQEALAEKLRRQAAELLELFSFQNLNNIVERMKLSQMSKMLNSQPALRFAVMIKNVLRKEKSLIKENFKKLHGDPDEDDLTHLMRTVTMVHDVRKKFQHLVEEINWERQNREVLQAMFQKNVQMNSQNDLLAVTNKIKQHEADLKTLSEGRIKHISECVINLKNCQNKLIRKLNEWRWAQHKSLMGCPFNDDLSYLQDWAEKLLAVNTNLRQEYMLIREPRPEQLSEIKERLDELLKDLIEGSFVVERQPPQVIKTQSKFSATVRHLLGDKLTPGKPVTVRAQIINELQARNLSLAYGDNVGELINNTAVMDKNTATRTTNATFRNMSIKKIKRADRKGAESVTEEKFALMFTTDVFITGYDSFFTIQRISQPVVIIVHGSQDNNAVATIIWDCAFAEPDRQPFVVPERVPWNIMVDHLNIKFRSEVQTNHELDAYNKHFLAQKVFDQPEYTDDFSNMMVTWCQFNKEVLPGRNFTFWQWFEGAMDLTKKHLRPYWSDGLIFGFIGKQHVHLILKQSPAGTFLLRFSDSEIGGITIAYVVYENGMPLIQNLQPFTKRDLEIRSLGDRIRDISNLWFLYPNLNKNEVFRKYYTGHQQPNSSGYIPVSLQTRVYTEEAASSVENNNFQLDPNLAGIGEISIAPEGLTEMDNSIDSFAEDISVLQIPGTEVPTEQPIFAIHNAQENNMEYDFFPMSTI